MTASICLRNIEFRVADPAADGDGRTLEGYAAVFNQDTEINSFEGHFLERISPGAFRKTLRENKNVIMQFNHGRDARVGQTPIGVYEELKEDDQGLHVRGRLFDNPIVEPVRQAIEAQAIRGMSFAFRVTRDAWTDNAGKPVRGDDLPRLLWDAGERGPLQRNIKEVQLMEAGPVVTPAYAGTSVGVRNLMSDNISDEDRAALIEEYRRTMVEEVGEERDLTDWLAAETRYNTELWLDAEKRWQDDVSAWLTAEQDFASRAAVKAPAKRVAENDAARTGTSTRNVKQDTTIRKDTAMNLAELRARAEELRAALAALGEEYRDAEMPAEAAGDFDAAEAELREVEGKVSVIEARNARIAELAKNSAHVERGAGTPAFKKESNPFDLDEIRADSYSTEDYLGRLDDAARRAADTAKYGVRDKASAAERVTELLDTVETDGRDLAKRMLLTGSEAYGKAWAKVIRDGNDSFCTAEERQALLRAQTLTGGSGNQGGYAVPFQLDPTVILTNAGVINPIRNLARIETIVGKTWQGVTTAGASVTRGAETDVAPDSSFTLGQPSVSTNRVQGFVPFSIELDLTWAALGSEITRVLVDAKQTEENSFITGDGTGTNPGGVVGSLSGNTVTAGGTAAFAAADVYKLHEALDPRWEAGASFMAHKAILNKIRQFDTYGGGLFWGSLAQANPGRLLDYPVERASAMDSALTTGKKILMFGDFKQFLIVDRIGMNVELVPHVFDTATGRPTGQRGIYAIWMNNSAILVNSAFKLLVTG